MHSFEFSVENSMSATMAYDCPSSVYLIEVSRTIVEKKDRLISCIMGILILVPLYSLQQWNQLYSKQVNHKESSGLQMPRISAVSVEDAVALVKLFIDHFRTDEIPKCTDNVWKEMSASLKGAWNAHCVFTNVKNDRRSILTKAREEMGVSVRKKQNYGNSFDSETEGSDAYENSNCHSSDDSSSQPKTFNNSIKNLVLTEEEWDKIKPSDEDDELKFKKKVWANIMHDELWWQFRMPCAFSFKRHEVRESPDKLSYLIKFVGTCKSKKCKNSITGIATKKLNQDGVTFALDMRDTRSENHERVKRPLNGEKRLQVYKVLMAEGCAKYRKSKAQKIMLPGDIEPPTLPTNEVLRQAKKEGNDKDLGIDERNGRDVIRSIEDMPLNPRYCGIIHEVAAIPFRVIYGSPAQFRVCQELRRLRRKNYTISLDATAGLVYKIQRNNSTKSSHIFLFAIVVNFLGTTACVFQMLSERHDSVTIMTWLFRWIQSGAPAPKQAVCDYSRALLMGISMAFNKQPIKEYINDRFRAISISSETLKLPTTLIRIDVAHFIHMVCRWKSFQRPQHRAIKDFFLRCVALMVESRTRRSFEEIFVLTCAVACQTHEDAKINLAEASSPKEARKRLENLISRGNIAEDYQNYESETQRGTLFSQKFVDGENNDDGEPEMDMDIDDERQTSIGKWIEDLIARAKKTLFAGENLNAFYLPDFIDRFAGVAKEFPLWTAVGMPPDTERATSSYVEGYFNDLKTRVLKQYSLPISVDKFMREHANDIAGANCIISAAMVQYNNERLYNNAEATNEVESVRVGVEKENDIAGANCIISAAMVQYNDDRLHSNNAEATNEVESARVEVGKEFEAAESELVENVSYFVDFPSETVEDKKDSDLNAVDNWRGKGDELELKNLWMNANPCESDNNNNSQYDSTFDIDIDTTNEDASKSHSEHSYCKLSRLAESHQDFTYRNFESGLNQRVDFSSPITQTVKQPLSEQPAKTSKYFKPFSEIRQKNALVTDKKKPGEKC